MKLNRKLLMRNIFFICSSRLPQVWKRLLELTCLFKIFLLIFLISCDNTPVSSGAKADELKLLFYNVRNITTTTATVLWSCSTASQGYLLYGAGNGGENTAFSIGKNKNHFVNLSGLPSATTIKFTAFCKTDARTVSTYFTNFTTTTSLNAVINRGIFIVGGVGNANTAVSQVDLYDPDTDSWTPNFTTLPTPRVYAGVVSYNSKIYVIGGLDSTLKTVSSAVEEFNPNTGTWRTMASMPLPIVGAVVSTVGTSIYVVAGSISGGPTTAISTPPLNTIYQFTPDTNTWTTLTSSSTILPRADMGGCAINGTIFLVTGRTYAGVSQNTSGAYIPSTNTVASGTVSSFNQTKHGAASACYRPISTDPFPNDAQVLVLVGGSTLNNVYYPPDSMTASNGFEVLVPGSTNTVTQGTVLPVNLYYPAVEFSYSKRNAYVFGGASSVNAPTQDVYYYSMASTGGIWTKATPMPVPRFGHKAVIVSR